MPLHAALNIAVVSPGGDACPMAEDVASGLAARGHRVRAYSGEAGYERVFRRLRAERPDAVSVHACSVEALRLAEGLPVLYTLHLPPSTALADACRQTRGWFAAPSAFAADHWRSAGIERIQLIRGGVAEFPLPPAVVRPLALIAERNGAMAALRAGLGIAMLGALGRSRKDLWRKLAHSAVCVAPLDEPLAFDCLAAQAQLAGCPVVGYADGALPEIVEEGVSGFLVAPGDERALAAAARRALMLDRHLVRRSARSRLSLEPMLDRYEAELRAIARRSVVRLVA